jgi:hypothetical protein
METDGDFTDPSLPSAKATEINKARQKVYGDPTPNMEVFAGLLSRTSASPSVLKMLPWSVFC